MAIHAKVDRDRDGEAGEGSRAFTLTKPFDPEALDAELSAKMGWRKHSGLVAEGLPAEASEDDPVTVWVLRGEDVDVTDFRSVVNAHDHVAVGEAKAQAAAPHGDVLESLREKMGSGEDLDPDEVQQALRALLLG